MFTDDGTVLYEAIQPAIIEWRPHNGVLRDFALAMITTVISFQSAAALLDLAFGLKRRGHAAICDIQTIRLVRDASPKQVLRNIFPATFHRFLSSSNSSLPHDSTSHPHWKPIRFTVLIKLFSLLILIPLCNIVPIILIFEYDSIVSLEEARVGNFGFGVNLNFTAESAVSTSLTCIKNNVAVRDRERAVVDFKRCVSTGFTDRPLNAGEGGIRIVGDTEKVTITVGTERLVAFSSVYGYLDVDPDAMQKTGRAGKASSFRVHHSLTEESARELARFGRGVLGSAMCKISDVGSEIAPSSTNVEGRFTYQENFQCSPGNFGSAGETVRRPTDADFSRNSPFELLVVQQMLWKIAFVQSNETRLLAPRENNGDGTTQAELVIVPADDLPFLKRRRSYASFCTLAILAGVVLLVRLIGKLFTRNDLEVGVGLILRGFLNLPSCDSLLPHSNLVIVYEEEEVYVERDDRWAQEVTVETCSADDDEGA